MSFVSRSLHAPLKILEAKFCRSTIRLSFCENRFCRSIAMNKKSFIRLSEVPFFDIFAFSKWSTLRMRTKVVSFFVFSKSFQTKNKALRPKMTKRASRGSYLGWFKKRYFHHQIGKTCFWVQRPSGVANCQRLFFFLYSSPDSSHTL